MPKFTTHGAARRVTHAAARLRNMSINLLESGNVHGARVEHPADFVSYVNRQGGRQPSGFPELWRVDERLKFNDPAPIAVVLNCYYTDLMDELLERLAMIPEDFDLYVTNTSGGRVDLPASLGRMRHGVVLDCENRGRDILPMIQVINAGLLNPYPVVLKVHTKKSPWKSEHSELRGEGTDWRHEFLDALLPSPERIRDMIAAFSLDPHLGIITAPGNILGPEFWGGDERITRQILRRVELDLDPKALRFPSGSMYWCRGFILQGLRSFNFIADDFDEEDGQVDGTTAHAVERLIGILTEEAGLTMTDPSAVEEGSANHLDSLGSPGPRATVLPFYLPQFHPSVHNNEWWGEGFTEWDNVAGAIPAYPGHYQPKLPADLGFYDLRLDEVREAQAALARDAGIAGFMYYYYWFSGERVLHLPIEKLHESTLDFPYCIMWANENWTRRWDGRSQDVLIGQDYEKVPAEDFIDDVMEFLLDPRYVRVNGKALVAVYRPGQMADFGAVAREWRSRARRAGVGDLHILSVSVATEFDAIDEASAREVDGTLEFPPHNLPWVAGPADRVRLDNRWRGNFMSYRATAEASIQRARQADDAFYPGAMVNFDNTARCQWRPDVWYGANPYTFRRWIGSHVDTLLTRDREDRLLFINAWNEWAEGAVLEPTTRFGVSFLLALRDAIQQ